jgi:methylated-DNA-[protein]-cysteine S-methyltransferase
MTTIYYRMMDSPVGPLTIAGDDGGLTNMRMEDQAHPPHDQAGWLRDDSIFPEAAEQLAAYFAGELFDFDLPLSLRGTPFQLRVWAALQEIPYGETRSYGWLAQRIDKPTASRAVGMANGRNPIGIIVPCHRVIGANGKLVGYGGGLDRKHRLLELERGNLFGAAAQWSAQTAAQSSARTAVLTSSDEATMPGLVSR